MNAAAVVPASPPPSLAMGWTQALATTATRGLLRLLFPLEVRGRANLPAAEPVLLCANHTSHVDTVALACGTGDDYRRLVFLAARDYFFQYRAQSGMIRRLICLLPFERAADMAAAKHNLRILGACRDAGRIVVLFPEGTRSPDGRMREFKPGVAMFAEKLGMRVVPCRIEGAHAVLAKGGRLPRPGPLRVTFGPPLALPARRDGETGTERAQRYQRFILELHEVITRLGTPAPLATAAVARA